ncbi:MAG TPA: tRNA (adenosine(37)-N6)-threonylcarbamoyltransferase complex ATPase subunit type 1 TsaE [Mucilaginibacter sp.]|nr:tRNA (adenosine(37)-N6)-threonylcarbamoyltransferase complex ATPase subunit type 1 TsaE [Mucilaginibacter sp.]
MELTIKDTGDLELAARKLIGFAGDEKVFLFYGDMGAGKTTFIQSVCKYLGATGTATSPTFSIVNEYERPPGRIFHFDFYRLKNQTEALDLGYEEYFYSGHYCFIEWPEKISELVPEHYIRIDIKVLSKNERLLTFKKI